MIERIEFETLLRQLVQIKSPYFHEDEIMEFVHTWFCQRDIPAEIHTFYEEKETDFHGKNVVGILDSGREGPCIYLGGHLDTVMQCDGWEHPPYAGVVEDEKMYGIGTLDMKSGCAAIMLAVERFAKNCAASENFCGKLIYHLVSDEEGPYGLGTIFIIKDKIHQISEQADFAIIAEPSAGFTKVAHPCLCLGAKGGYNYTVKVYGKSAHAATPELGINALADASAIVSELEKIEPVRDEKLGESALCVIRMQGGGAACSVPDYAEVEIFQHTVRGETKTSIEENVRQAIARANIRSRVEVTFRKPPVEGFDGGFDAYCIDENDPILAVLTESAEEVCKKDVNIAYFQSIGDFNHIGGKLRIPTVLFGPDGKNFHSSEEFADLRTAVETANTIEKFLTKVLLKKAKES